MRAEREERKKRTQIGKKLGELFGGHCRYGEDTWTISNYSDWENITARTLFQACEILGCRPEELFWNPDLDRSDCYYVGDIPDQTLVLRVVKS